MNNIYWKNATPEQHIAWDYVYGIADALGAVAVTPLYEHRMIFGTEYLVYDVNKLYFALDLWFGVPEAAGSLVEFHDETDGVRLNFGSYFIAANNTVINECPKNIYFSRFTTVSLTYMRFNGYRLDITP